MTWSSVHEAKIPIQAKREYIFARDCSYFAYNSYSSFPSSSLQETLQLRRHVTSDRIWSTFRRNFRWSLTSLPLRIGYRTAFQNNRSLFGAIQKVCHHKYPNFWPPSPFVTVCHRLPWPTFPPCHHSNSDKLVDPKLAEKSLFIYLLALFLTEHIRMPKSHTEWQQLKQLSA